MGLTAYELYQAQVKAPANSLCPPVAMNNALITKFYSNKYERLVLLLSPPIFPSLPRYEAQSPTGPELFHSLSLDQACPTRKERSAYFVALSINRSASLM